MNEGSMVEAALLLIQERGLSHIHCGWFDSNGTLRTKKYAAGHMKKGFTAGIPFIAIPSGIGPDDEIVPTNGYMQPERGFANGAVLLDAASLREVPFSDPPGLLLLGQFRPPEADDCVRSRLAAELARLSELGFDLFGGFEMEGAVLLETPDSMASKRAEEVAEKTAYSNTFSFVEQVDDDPFLSDVLHACAQADIAIDTLHPEYLGMLEVALAPQPGMRMADNAALYRAVAKLAGRRHGRLLSFMARRRGDQQGCGAHMNISLRHRDTEDSAFFDADASDGLSVTAHHFIGGLIRYLPELFLLMVPNLNSFKRFRPNLFTPLSNTWGIDNKSVAFRAINVGASSARVEVRFPGADLCPHLGLAAAVAAGRAGIQEAIEPPPPVTGSGWDVEDAPGTGFPLGFEDAIHRLDGSAFARRAFGDGFVDNFVGDRRWQLEQFANVVTDWEIRTFGNL